MRSQLPLRHRFVPAAQPVIYLESITKRNLYCAFTCTYLTLVVATLLTIYFASFAASSILVGVREKCPLPPSSSCKSYWNSSVVSPTDATTFPKGLVTTLSRTLTTPNPLNTPNSNSNNSNILISGTVNLNGYSATTHRWTTLVGIRLHHRIAVCNSTTIATDLITNQQVQVCALATITLLDLLTAKSAEARNPMKNYQVQVRNLSLATTNSNNQVLAALHHTISHQLFVQEQAVWRVDWVVRLSCMILTILFYIYWIRETTKRRQPCSKWIQERQWITVLFPMMVLVINPIKLFATGLTVTTTRFTSTTFAVADLCEDVGLVSVLLFWAHSMEAVKTRHLFCPQLCSIRVIWYIPLVMSLCVRNILAYPTVYTHHKYQGAQTWMAETAFATLALVLTFIFWSFRMRCLYLRSKQHLSRLSYGRTRFQQLSFQFFNHQTTVIAIAIALSAVIQLLRLVSISSIGVVSVLAQFEALGSNANYFDTGLVLLLTCNVLVWSILFWEPAKVDANVLHSRAYFRKENDAVRARLETKSIRTQSNRSSIDRSRRGRGGINGGRGRRQEKTPFCVEFALEMLKGSYQVYFDPDYSVTTKDNEEKNENENKNENEKKNENENEKKHEHVNGSAKCEVKEENKAKATTIKPAVPSPWGVWKDSPQTLFSDGYVSSSAGWNNNTDTHWEISIRPSRNRIVVGIRGTASVRNWQTNCRCMSRDHAKWLFQGRDQFAVESQPANGCAVYFDRNGQVLPATATATETATMPVRRQNRVKSISFTMSSSPKITTALLTSNSNSNRNKVPSSAEYHTLGKSSESSSPLSSTSSPSSPPSHSSPSSMVDHAMNALDVASSSADVVLQPMIHRGFAEAYLSIRVELRRAIQHALAQCDSTAPIELCFTGHSLGGALCTLAGLDTFYWQDQSLKNPLSTSTISPAASCGSAFIRLFTFGAPRVGNHRFAKIVNDKINDSWRVVLDGDPIPSVPKLYLMGNMYKHAQRHVLLDLRGNLIIDPLHVERLLHEDRKTNFGAHNLDLYTQALEAAFGDEEVVEEEAV